MLPVLKRTLRSGKDAGREHLSVVGGPSSVPGGGTQAGCLAKTGRKLVIC